MVALVILIYSIYLLVNVLMTKLDVLNMDDVINIGDICKIHEEFDGYFHFSIFDSLVGSSRLETTRQFLRG